ncbi:MAG: DUF2855 family protein [Gammaproteobacteria bacterium]|nr:DUF2855 family protein [Gammaproteobacteria bacterium]
MSEFQVQKNELATHRIVETPLPKAGAGEIVARIERFAFTANNITYGVTGDRLGYWQFFPPGGDNGGTWGLLPVWGVADVVESNVDEVPVGDRLFGYFPPATTLKITPVGVTDQRLIDGATHRKSLPPPYNSYRRVYAEPGYDNAMDNERMLLYPLYITSFSLWDYLLDNDWYDAQQIVIVSASSKTSIGLAFALHADSKAPPVTGITSARNVDFVTSLGHYDQTLSYDELGDIDASLPTTIVDMSGNREVLGKLHARLGDNMKRTLNVGLTHWEEQHAGEGFIAERSHLFFAPSHIQQRLKEWGPRGFEQRSTEFMIKAALASRAWLHLERLQGLEGLAGVYADVCAGRTAPYKGLIVEL